MTGETSTEQKPPAVLAVLAHPDDETFRCGGTLALLARRGVRVQTLTATRGGGGSCGDPPLCTRDRLPEVREEELRCACRVLGIEPPRLLDYEDGTLSAVDDQEGAAHVLDAIDELRPQVLITWPRNGLSGHADHVAVSGWTGLAFEAAGALGPQAPLGLAHMVVPESVAEALGFSGLRAVPDGDVSVAVDVRAVWEEKLEAIRCHRTQTGESPILRAPRERQELFLGIEHFQQAAGRGEDDVLARCLTTSVLNSEEVDDE
ncbi:MAG: PIG-L deacetylase family protein [Chloroflexota bacterium]